MYVQMRLGQQPLELGVLALESRSRFASGTSVPPYLARHL